MPQRRRLEISGRPRPWVIAHRGASIRRPENSLAAFRLAVEHGADLIETDLWRTADGHLVCHHDETLKRMCGDPRRIVDLPLEAVRSLRLENRDGSFSDEKVPLLEELLQVVPSHVAIVLELKDPSFFDPAVIDQLVREVGSERLTAVIAFDLSLLKAVRARAPGFITGHIARYNPFPLQPTELLGPFYPMLWLNPWYVRWAQRRGRHVCPLDPHLHRHLKRYLRLGVDAVLTDDPLETRQRIDELRGG